MKDETYIEARAKARAAASDPGRIEDHVDVVTLFHRDGSILRFAHAHAVRHQSPAATFIVVRTEHHGGHCYDAEDLHGYRIAAPGAEPVEFGRTGRGFEGLDGHEIYVLTAMHPTKHRRRAWGWYVTLEQAVHAVMHDPSDMFFEAGEYDHLVIERVKEGSLAMCEDVRWFRCEYPGATNENPMIVAIDKPEWAALTCNFGMG